IQQVTFGNAGEVLLATRRGGVGVLTTSGGYAITRRDSLIDDNIYDILERPGRPRLYACGAGLCAQVDDTTMVSFQAGAGLPRGEAQQVVGDAQTAYVRVACRGIFQFDGRHASAVDAPGGVSFVDAMSISLGPDHALWVAGPDWVVVRRNGKWLKVETPARPGARWHTIVADGAGAFVGSSDGVVFALNRGTQFNVSLGDGLPGADVASLRPDGNGSAWFVSGGRVVSASATAQRVAVEKAPLDAEAVEISPAGGLVVAGRWTVSRKNDAGWADMSPDIDEPDMAFASVFVDRQNMVWVGARSGALYRYDGEIWLRYAEPNVSTGPLRDVRAFRASDVVLLGSTPAQCVNGSWSRFSSWDSTATVVDLATDSNGDWFAATSDRVFRYDAAHGAWQSVGVDGASASARATWKTPAPITALSFDDAGRMFVGTTDGFGCITRGQARWWNAGDGIGGERVRDLATDGTTLWVGYGEDGMTAIPLAELR
ncbi:MAG TPA: hypothetical protein VFH88_10145, partial [Candidatus Krumholzibacteria bacterium]|nr:hypothetical protein [Candidatus Krumholzibacteria bacterium]